MSSNFANLHLLEATYTVGLFIHMYIHTYVLMHIRTYVHLYTCICMRTYIQTYIPITVTVPSVLVVVGLDATTHWKVVVPSIENAVNE